MTGQISLVITCGDWLNLEREIEKAETVHADFLHMDVMDGEFVPNYMGGTNLVRSVHAKTAIRQDMHLMVTEPERKLSYFQLRKGDYISFHPESSKDPQRVIDLIHKAGCAAGLVLSPDREIDTLKPYLNDIEYITVLCVRPGFAGQKILPGMKEKLRKVRELIDSVNPDLLLEVDGNVSYENAVWMKACGADIFALGATSVYGEGDFVENVQRIKSIVM